MKFQLSNYEIFDLLADGSTNQKQFLSFELGHHEI